MKLIPIVAASVALAVLSAPALATDITFAGGHASVSGPVSTDPSMTGTNFSDIFTFNTTGMNAISGQISTHSLTDLMGNVVEDLDFTSITLDGVSLADHSSSDANENWSLASSPLGAGQHTLVVNYNIDVASSANLAAYSGDLFLAGSAVPEPASWAMMLGGFGIVGAGMRSRQRKTVTIAA